MGILASIIDFFLDPEFWKQIPPSEPYRVILGDVRDKLYLTRERARHLLANEVSDIPEEASYTNVEQVSSYLLLEKVLKSNCRNLHLCYNVNNIF